MKSPYKFLDSYTKDDRNVFFGRDREIEELYQKVFDSKLLLVYGVSGTGKSSLIHCGLANKFQDADWLPIVIRRGGNMIESLAAGIIAASITVQQSKFASPGDFKKGVRSLYLDHYKPIFFLFDQFEELFIFGDKEERKTFINVVKTLTESDLQCRMIFVMREEYMAWVTEFERVIPTFFSNRVRIEKMSHLNALDAITGPCNAFNIRLEEGFAEALLEKLSPGDTDVELTYLQDFLDKVFRLAADIRPPLGGEPKGGSARTQELKDGLSFTLSHLSQTGNVSDLLGSFLDDQISLMADPDMAMTVLKAFVSGKGTKRPASEQEAVDNIKSFGKNIPQEKVRELIQSFVKLRVLRDKDDNERFELRHDALAEKVYEKFSTAEKELLEIRQFIENSYQSFLRRKVLLSNEDLIYISDKDSAIDLNPELRDFLVESRKHNNAQKRTVRRLTTVSFISFIVLVGTFGYFTLNKIAETRADYQVLRLMTVSDPLNRLVNAYKIWEKHPDALQKEAILKAFNEILESPGMDSIGISIADDYKITFDPAPVPIQYAYLSKDGSHIFGYGDSLVLIWSLARGKLESKIVTGHTPVIDLKLSNDNNFIGAVGKDSILTVWDVNGSVIFSRTIQYNNVNTKQIFTFTNENDVIALSDSCDAVYLNADGNQIQTFKRHSGRVNGVDLSPDNRFIATASSDKTINVWYFNSVKKRYDFYDTLTWHRDTVWSVLFCKNNINLISTSSDYRNIIGNINNNENTNFGLLYYDTDSDNYNRIKACYARIINSGNGIVFLSYSRQDNKLNKFYYGYNRFTPKYVINNRDGDEKRSVFSALAFSEDEKYYACSERDKVYLVDNFLGLERNKLNITAAYTLMELSGKNPVFSADNKYLYYSDRNYIKSVFIDMETIRKLSSEFPEK